MAECKPIVGNVMYVFLIRRGFRLTGVVVKSSIIDTVFDLFNRCSNPNVTYAPGLSVDAPKRGQGHPLKSFSVPGPPSTQQLLPNQPKHNGECTHGRRAESSVV